jgi:hypothetical protein
VAYDAVVVTATSTIVLSVARAGTNLNLTWNGGATSYVIEKSTALPPSSWSGVVTTGTQNASVPIAEARGFFRVRGN